MQQVLASRKSVGSKLYAAVLVVLGLAMLIPGLRLIALGGSPYYVVAGAMISASGILVWRARRLGAAVYASMLVLTLAWSLWEVGNDLLSVLPRLGIFLIVGLGFCTPWAYGATAPATQAGGKSGFPRYGALLTAIAAIIGIAAIAVYLVFERLEQPLERIAPQSIGSEKADGDWVNYGNSPGGTRFSPVAQITTSSVGQLTQAWEFDATPEPGQTAGMLELTPLKIDDTLYVCTGYNDVIAIDAETGKQRWRHDVHTDPVAVPIGACRGVAFYKVPGATGACSERIFTATVDARLIALDRFTGDSCASFGDQGVTNLLDGMGAVIKAYYYVTSAPQIIRGKIVLGGSVLDNQSVDEPPGVVRAYDAVTGRLAWAWDLGRPGEHGQPAPGQSYTRSTPNSWAPLSADEALGLVFVPTGNAPPDYFGAHRTALMDRFSSSVVALDAESGEPRWSFQTTHHDLWDYDVPSQPTLIEVQSANGTAIPALVQATKRGELFVLDRRTGQPIFPVEERAVPQQPALGERLSPTQPYSSFPAFPGELPREGIMWGFSPFDQLWCRIKFREARFDGSLTPPVLGPFIASPGFVGGMEWGGVSVDPDHHLLVFPSNKLSNYTRLITRAEADARGVKPASGKPIGSSLGDVMSGAQAGTPYAVIPGPFLSPLGMPCERPPFGWLNAVDYDTGKRVWSRPLGVMRDLGPMGIPTGLPLTVGSPLTGGALVTRGGLTFIGASQDHELRAFETSTGRLLWRADLPASAQATPMTYVSPASGRQFVVVAASGNFRLGKRTSNAIVGFALPAAPR